MRGNEMGGERGTRVDVTLRDGETAVLVLSDPFSEHTVVAVDDRLPFEETVLVDVRFGSGQRGGLLDAFRDRYTVVDEEVVSPTMGDGAAPVTTERSGVTVRSVAGPDDMTGYGVALNQSLERWSGRANVVVICDSLTALLQHVSTNAAFRFVHVLAGRLAREDAVLVCRLDPEAHDERTVASLMQPFDVVVETRADGVSVRRRE